MTVNGKHAGGRSRDNSWRADLGLVVIGLVPLAVILVLVFQPPAPRSHLPRQEVVGRVQRLIGRVQGRPEDTLVWNPLRIGTPVHRREHIFAGEDSEALVVLDDTSSLVVEENSLVVVSRSRQQEAAAPISIELLRGGISGRGGTHPLRVSSGGNRADLAAGATVAIRRNRDDSLLVELHRGRGKLRTLAGRQVSLQEKHQVRVASDGLPGAGRRLDIAIVAPEDGQHFYYPESLPLVEFRWSAVGGKEYEFLLGRDADLQEPLVRQGLKKPATRVSLPAGVYFWRVSSGRAISPLARLAVVEDRPPVCRQPVEGTVLLWQRLQGLFLAWTEVGGAEHYLLEILDDGGRVVFNKRVQATSYRLGDSLPEGHYCFRVRVDDAARGRSPWCRQSCFRLIHKPIPRPPRLFNPQVETIPSPTPEPDHGSWLLRLVVGVAHAEEPPRRKGIILRWEKVPGIDNYQLEIAEDLAFRKVVLRRLVKNSYFTWRHLTQRRYFWRVKSIDSEGREGEFSSPRIIGAVVAPPQPWKPPAGKIFNWARRTPAVELRWRGSELLRDVVVELGRDAELSSTLVSRHLGRKTRFLWRPERTGTYYWRLVGIDLNGRHTRPSRVTSFRLVPAVPRILAPLGGEKFSRAKSQEGITFRWSPRPCRFQWQLFPGRGRKSPLLAKATAARSVRLPVKQAGEWTWRVRCLDPPSGWSKVGHFLVEAARQVAPPPPLAAPRLLAPAPGARIITTRRRASLRLNWQPVAGATGYLVAVDGPAGGSVPLRRRLVETHLDLDNLAPGTYRWRVRSERGTEVRSQAMKQPPPGTPPGTEVQKAVREQGKNEGTKNEGTEVTAARETGNEAVSSFEIVMRIPPRAPVLTRPAMKEHVELPPGQQVRFSWKPVARAHSYQLELSRDKDFDKPHVTRTVSSAGIGLSLPGEGAWWWRVRAREDDGFSGKWSEGTSFSYEVSKPPITERAVFVGVHVDFFHNLGEINTAQPSLELAYRLPFWRRRLGLALQVGYLTATASTTDEAGTRQASSRLHAVPVEIAACVAFPVGPVNLYLGAGPRLEFSRVSIQPGDIATSNTSFGVVGLAGIEGKLGPGWLFAELRYTWMSALRGVVELHPGGLLAGAGYRLGIW